MKFLLVCVMIGLSWIVLIECSIAVFICGLGVMEGVRNVLGKLRDFGEMLEKTYNTLENVVTEIGKYEYMYIIKSIWSHI
mgnify:CR=1 FL=1